MGANFLNFRAHEIYTMNGNLISETFVEWDKEKNKCFAGFVVSGKNVGIDETDYSQWRSFKFFKHWN